MHKFWHRNASTILTCLGGVGVAVTAVMAVKATPKAMKLIEKAEKEKGSNLTKVETVKTAGKCYIPAIVTGVATVACIFGANTLNKRQQAALMSAYALLDSSYKEYIYHVKDICGEDVHQEIMEAIAAEKAEAISLHAPGFVDNNGLYLDAQCGETRLFYDEYGQRFFEATLEQVISAEYHLNRNYTMRGYTVLNEFYDFVGIEPTDYGSEMGWVINDDGTFWIEFNHREVDIRGTKCVLIEMPFGPSPEWREYY